jgi:hypothetical protein
MEIIEMILNEETNTQGVYAVSVVKSPAIEDDWVYLNQHFVELQTIDEEKRILMGAVLIPKKMIPRRDKEHGDFSIWFSAETILKASQMFLSNNNQNNVTFEHEMKVDGMSVVESWIVEDPKMDKSNLYNFSNPKGTWMISMKVNNDSVWEQVKLGNIKGFSIEGKFASHKESMSAVNDLTEYEQIIEKVKQILNQ